MMIFLSSCIQGGSYNYLSSLEDKTTDQDDGRRRLRNSIRDRSLNSDSSNYCRESQNCKEVCDSIYLKATDLDRCYNTRENRVDEIADTFGILINPRRLSHLNDIDDQAFSDFLNIGYRGFLDLIDPIHIDEDGDRRHENWEDLYAYDSITAELVLEWIAEEEKASKSIQFEDKQGEVLRHLVCLVGQQYCSSLEQLLCNDDEKIDSRVIIDEEPSCDNLDNIVNSCDSTYACHDGSIPIILGLGSESFDGVDLATYSRAQDNDSLNKMVEDLALEVQQETTNVFSCFWLTNEIEKSECVRTSRLERCLLEHSNICSNVRDNSSIPTEAAEIMADENIALGCLRSIRDGGIKACQRLDPNDSCDTLFPEVIFPSATFQQIATACGRSP